MKIGWFDTLSSVLSISATSSWLSLLKLWVKTSWLNHLLTQLHAIGPLACVSFTVIASCRPSSWVYHDFLSIRNGCLRRLHWVHSSWVFGADFTSHDLLVDVGWHWLLILESSSRSIAFEILANVERRGSELVSILSLCCRFLSRSWRLDDCLLWKWRLRGSLNHLHFDQVLD